MRLFEKYGVVTDINNSWRNLCKLIVDYVYDVENGLNTDPFYDPKEGSTITKRNITSYAKYTAKVYDKLVPDWIDNFEIFMKPFFAKGCWKSKQFNNGKLSFEVTVDIEKMTSPAILFSTLMHEFKHAYDFYIEKSKGIQMNSDHDKKRYSIAVRNIKKNPTKTIDFFITGYYLDGVIVDDKIYHDVDDICQILQYSMYMTNNKEISSHKEDFNNALENREAIESQYNVQIYRIYAAYKMFWENINKINDETKEKFCAMNTEMLKEAGFIYTKNIDYDDVFKRMQKMFLPRLNTALKAFDKIYNHVI